MTSKRFVITFILVFCCLTVVPILLLLANAMAVDYDRSVIGGMIDELKGQ